MSRDQRIRFVSDRALTYPDQAIELKDDQAKAADNVTDKKNKFNDDDELRPYASPPCYQQELAPLFQEPMPENDWTSVRHWRRAQRKQLRERRQSIGAAEQDRASTAIMAALEKEPRLTAGSVAFYWPMDGELDLRPLMSTMRRRNINVALPVIVEKDAPLEFWAWHENTKMQADATLNIPVPADRDLITPAVLFVPLLGFDEQGHRLGHGGGYYDRTLAGLDPRPLAIGIGYELGRLPSIYPQSHDIPMDAIVTEKGVTWCDR